MIGVFDSGHGGLTILQALTARLPGQHFAYLGDHAHAPYGERTPEEIFDFTVASVERLFNEGCHLVLLACNTAAAVALRRLQQEWLPGAYPDRRVLGVFVPMVEAVTRVPWHVTCPQPCAPEEKMLVGVFATRRTVVSGAYPLEISLRTTGVEVVQQACPGLVSRIEEDAADDVLYPMIYGFVADLRDALGGRMPDAVILGCTHYPLVEKAFAEALPASVQILRQPDLVADSLADYLTRHPEFATPEDSGKGAEGRRAFFTSGDPARASALGSRFFGSAIEFQPI